MQREVALKIVDKGWNRELELATTNISKQDGLHVYPLLTISRPMDGKINGASLAIYLDEESTDKVIEQLTHLKTVLWGKK